MAEKKCSKCGAMKPIDCFYHSRGKPMAECKACHAEYIRARRAQDPEKYNAWHREYRARNKERVIGYQRKAAELYPLRRREYTARSRKRNPAKAIFNAAKHRAQKYGIPFSITIEDIVIPERCPILGIEFGPNTGRGAGAFKDSMSLDRIVPELGYAPGNVQVMSRLANSMKSNANREELLKFSAWIQENFG